MNVFFIIECKVGFYGKNCNIICGKCLNSIICYYIIGSCDKGCDFGYEGLICKKGMRFMKMYICGVILYLL